MNSSIKKNKRIRRHAKIRKTLAGSSERPRMAVFKSNRAIYVQLIDDVSGVTLASANSIGLKKTPLERAREVGGKIGKLAKEKKIEKVVFDRGGFLYTGHIKALADGAREAGLIF